MMGAAAATHQLRSDSPPDLVRGRGRGRGRFTGRGRIEGRGRGRVTGRVKGRGGSWGDGQWQG